jgi:hypothetical protein
LIIIKTANTTIRVELELKEDTTKLPFKFVNEKISYSNSNTYFEYEAIPSKRKS